MRGEALTTFLAHAYNYRLHWRESVNLRCHGGYSHPCRAQDAGAGCRQGDRRRRNVEGYAGARLRSMGTANRTQTGFGPALLLTCEFLMILAVCTGLGQHALPSRWSLSTPPTRFCAMTTRTAPT